MSPRPRLCRASIKSLDFSSPKSTSSPQPPHSQAALPSGEPTGPGGPGVPGRPGGRGGARPRGAWQPHCSSSPMEQACVTAWLAPAAVIANTKAVSRMSVGAGGGAVSLQDRCRVGGRGVGRGGEGRGGGAGRQGQGKGAHRPVGQAGSSSLPKSPRPLIPLEKRKQHPPPRPRALPTLTLLQDAPEGLAVAGAVPATETELELALSYPKPGAPG